MHDTRRALATLAAAATVFLAGCHSEVELPPLPEAKISVIGDRFFDVKALSPDRALVIGYGGKVLETTDSGRTWNVIKTPTDRALYNIRFADQQNGWICGQAGLILNTKDGGKTWTEQKSNTEQYLFAIYAVSPTHVYAVGDKSVLVETTDGGNTWKATKIVQKTEGISQDIALAVQDPIFYDIEFANDKEGWVVGEFGTIRQTTDGGQTWTEQQESLLGEGIVDVFDLPTLFGVHFVNNQGPGINAVRALNPFAPAEAGTARAAHRPSRKKARRTADRRPRTPGSWKSPVPRPKRGRPHCKKRSSPQQS